MAILPENAWLCEKRPLLKMVQINKYNTTFIKFRVAHKTQEKSYFCHQSNDDVITGPSHFCNSTKKVYY